MKNKYFNILLITALAIAGVLSIFASSFPDGLERVAENQNFIETAYSIISGIMPDYLFPGIANESLATGLAGIVGVFLVFAVTLGLGKIIFLSKKYE